MIRKTLIFCGLLSSLYYAAINVFVPRLFEGYNVVTQTVSELSAIDAPTRSLWVPLAFFYVLLFGAFGVGVWLSSGISGHLRTMAWLIAIYCLVNLYWPPMHLRGNAPTLTDAMHIVWAMITIFLMMLLMIFGAAAFGNKFRIYTTITFVVFVAFGLLISKEAPNITSNLPTPYIGLWERINIGVFMLWIIFFSIALLKKSPLEELNKNKQTRKAVLNIGNKSL